MRLREELGPPRRTVGGGGVQMPGMRCEEGDMVRTKSVPVGFSRGVRWGEEGEGGGDMGHEML